MEWLRKKLIETLSGSQPLNKKLLGFIAAAVSLVVYLISNASVPASEPIVLSSPSQSTAILDEASIYVHLVGEVKNPGIYQLDAGARLIDAILAAQGFTEAADQGSVNLARPLTDGEQIFITAFGDGSGATQVGGGSMTGSGGGGNGLISLNRADQTQLESLPGVGPALAGRIIDYREANGGFKSVSDLLNVSGIGDKVFAGLKDLVTL